MYTEDGLIKKFIIYFEIVLFIFNKFIYFAHKTLRSGICMLFVILFLIIIYY